jgi:hypothetical protein
LGDVEMIGEGGQFYIIVNGVKIAKRENCQWTSLVSGYSVEDLDGCERIAIDVDCSKLPSSHRKAIQQRAGCSQWPRNDPSMEGLAWQAGEATAAPGASTPRPASPAAAAWRSPP